MTSKRALKSAKCTFSKMASNKVTGRYLLFYKSPTSSPLNRTGVFLEVAKYALYWSNISCCKWAILLVINDCFQVFLGSIFRCFRSYFGHKYKCYFGCFIEGICYFLEIPEMGFNKY